MMAPNLEDMLQARSLEENQALPRTEILQTHLPEDLVYVAIFAMSGHDHTIAAIRLCGSRIGQHILICNDPRSHDELRSMFERLAELLLSYVRSYIGTPSFPSFVFSNQNAVELLRRAGEYMNKRRMPPNVQECGKFIAFLYKRYHQEGQQLVVDVTNCVHQHYMTGLPTGHIGVLKAWLEGSTSVRNLLNQMETAEEYAAGSEIKPADDEKLANILTPYSTAKKNNVQGTIQSVTAKLHPFYTPLLGYQIDTMSWIIQHIQAAGFQNPNVYLEQCITLERQAFHGYSNATGLFDGNGSVQGYIRFPQYESIKQRTLDLNQKESLTQNLHLEKLSCDRFARFKAESEGKLVTGRVTRHLPNIRHGFEIHVSQPTVRLRQGDLIHRLGVERWGARILSMQHTATARQIQLQMTAGTRKYGLPNLGDPLLLCKEKRTWGFTGKMLSIFSRRLNFQPQTHFTNGTLASTPRPSISDFSLLRFLETLK